MAFAVIDKVTKVFSPVIENDEQTNALINVDCVTYVNTTSS